MKERIKGAFTKKKIFHFLKMALFVVALSLILLSLLGTVAHATGLVDDTINAENLYSKYPLSNYQLDFYVDNSWSWLPWNWLDGIGKSVQYGLYCITNFVWTISLYLSNATGYVVQEAYKLDFINDMADSIGKSMVFFLLFFNLGITIFVFLLTGMMLFSQILFIIFAMFLPISFLLSMIPSYESMAKQAIVMVFNTIMTRAGITLIVTVAFSISSMFYNISTDYPFFMVAFLQIVCFAGIYMKLGDLMSMFSLNANDSQSMGRRIFRRPYLYLAHRARRMERRLAGAVTAGGVAGAVAGSSVAGKRAERKNTASKENRGNTTSSMGQRAGSKVGAVLDTKNKVKDKANAVKENIKDMPTQTAYAVYSAKEKAKSSVSDFKRGMVQEQQSRQTGRLEKQEQHRQNIADKRMELQKAQEARQAQRKADGSATTGATRPHERPATASSVSKTGAEKMQEVKRPATATTSKISEPVKANVIKERPLSSGASDRKTTQPAQPVHRQNVEKVVSQETRQNDTKDRRTKVQQTQTVQKNQQTKEKNRSLVTKKGQKKK